MKKIIYFTIVVVVSVLSTTSCEKKETTPTSLPSPMPTPTPAPVTFEKSFTCTNNGVAFTASKVSGSRVPIGIVISGEYGGNTVNVGFDKSVKVGVSAIKTGGSSYETADNFYYCDRGTLTIISHDTIKKEIKGNFTMVALNGWIDDSVVIKNGYFSSTYK